MFVYVGLTSDVRRDGGKAVSYVYVEQHVDAARVFFRKFFYFYFDQQRAVVVVELENECDGWVFGEVVV